MDLLPFHIVAGLAAVVSGFVAMTAPKGRDVHRKSGRVFLASMIVLGSSGVILAGASANAFARMNLLTSALVLYMVVSSVVTVRLQPARAIDTGTLAAAAALTITSFALGLDAATRSWALPTPMFFVFGSFALMAAVGDARRLALGERAGNRIARHLWRMGFALCLVTISLTSGQANKVLPEAFRQPVLFGAAVVGLIVAVLYWFVRVLVRGRVAVPTANRSTPLA